MVIETENPVKEQKTNYLMRLNNPYWFELFSVLIIAIVGILTNMSFLPGVVVAVVTTVLLDLAISHFRGEKLYLSKSAAITGLLIGSILYGEMWVFAFAGAVAILSKHLIKIKRLNVFNPAALGILLSVLLFFGSDLWWSSTQTIAVIILGLLVTWKIQKLKLALSFLVVFFLLNVLLLPSVQGSTLQNASIVFFSLPVFLAFFMLTDPKTTPFQRQLFWGPVFAVVMFALLLTGFQSLWVGGLLLGNLIYALHRKWK